MHFGVSVCMILSAALVGLCPVEGGATENSLADALGNLAASQRIRLSLISGQVIDGAFGGVRADTVSVLGSRTLAGGRLERSATMDAILRVEVAEGRRSSSVLKGAAIGVAVVVAAFAITGNSGSDDPAVAYLSLGLGVAGGFIGAGAGSVLFEPEWRLAYE